MNSVQAQLINSFQDERQSKLPAFERLREMFGAYQEIYLEYIQHYPLLHRQFFSLRQFQFYMGVNISLAYAQMSFSPHQLQRFVINYFKYSFDLAAFRYVAEDFLASNSASGKYASAFILSCLLFAQDQEDRALEVFSVPSEQDVLLTVARRDDANKCEVPGGCQKRSEIDEDSYTDLLPHASTFAGRESTRASGKQENECTELRMQNLELDEENAVLRARLQALQCYLYRTYVEAEASYQRLDRDSGAEIETLRYEIDCLRAELRRKDDFCAQQSRVAEEASSAVIALQQQLYQAESAAQLHRTELERAKAQAETLNQYLVSTTGLLKKAATEFQGRIGQLAQASQSDALEHASARELIQRYHIDLRALRSKYEEKCAEASDLQAKLNHFSERAEVNAQFAAELAAGQDKLERLRTALELEKDALELAKGKNRVQEVEQQLKDAVDALNASYAEMKAARAEIGSLRQINSAFTSKIQTVIYNKANMPATLLAFTSENCALQQRVCELGAEKARLVEKLTEQMYHNLAKSVRANPSAFYNASQMVRSSPQALQNASCEAQNLAISATTDKVAGLAKNDSLGPLVTGF